MFCKFKSVVVFFKMCDYDETAVISSFASKQTFLQVGKIVKQREIVLVACFPFSARYLIFQRNVRIDTD